MMINEFSRTEMPIDTEGMNKLRSSTVAVSGAGGVGSHAAEAPARYGVGRLILMDNDTVSLTNINRRSIALHSTMGQFRAWAMKDEIAGICPGIQVITFERFVLPDNIESPSERMKHQMGQDNFVDYILDAIDTVTAKLALVGFAASHAVPVIAPMGTGSKFHPEPFRMSDTSQTFACPLRKAMRRKLKARNIRKLKVRWSPEQPLTPEQTVEDTGCRRATSRGIFFVPPVAGLAIAGEVIRDICGLAQPQISLSVL